MEYENRGDQATQYIIEDMAAQVRQEKKKIDDMMQPLCDSLNALIPIKSDEDKDKMNALIADVQAKIPHFNLYWDREFYLDCNADGEELRKRTLHSGIVHFEPSDDPEEYPGIKVKYISHMLRFDGFNSIDKPLVAKTEDQRWHIEEILSNVNYVDTSEHGDVQVFIDGVVPYDKMAEIVDYLRTIKTED